jgi:hypothetical protein
VCVIAATGTDALRTKWKHGADGERPGMRTGLAKIAVERASEAKSLTGIDQTNKDAAWLGKYVVTQIRAAGC